MNKFSSLSTSVLLALLTSSFNAAAYADGGAELNRIHPRNDAHNSSIHARALNPQLPTASTNSRKYAGKDTSLQDSLSLPAVDSLAPNPALAQHSVLEQVVSKNGVQPEPANAQVATVLNTAHHTAAPSVHTALKSKPAIPERIPPKVWHSNSNLPPVLSQLSAAPAPDDAAIAALLTATAAQHHDAVSVDFSLTGATHSVTTTTATDEALATPAPAATDLLAQVEVPEFADAPDSVLTAQQPLTEEEEEEKVETEAEAVTADAAPTAHAAASVPDAENYSSAQDLVQSQSAAAPAVGSTTLQMERTQHLLNLSLMAGTDAAEASRNTTVPQELIVSFEHPTTLKESFMVAGNSTIISYGTEQGNFLISFKLRPVDREQAKELTFNKFRDLLTARFSDKENMLYGEYTILRALSSATEALAAAREGDNASTLLAIPDDLASGKVALPLQADEQYLDLSLRAFLKKAEDGILPDMQNFFYERDILSHNYMATLSCEFRGTQAQAASSKEQFRAFSPLCERIINSYRFLFLAPEHH